MAARFFATQVAAAAALCLLTAGIMAQDAPAAPTQDASAVSSFEELRSRARELAQHDYVPRDAKDLPKWLRDLDYDGYRQIRFRPESALWSEQDEPFRVQFLHRGYLFPRRVRVDEVADGGASEVHFSAAQFAYAEGVPPVPEDLGYSGLSLSWLAPDTLRRDEVAAFQGAGYFRLLGIGQEYGASARGLAIDTASPQGEEFPEFTELRVERPAPGAGSVVLDALLDSPGLSGAYRFVITPGARTSAEVTVCLFPRHEIGKLGIAPLTSMFLFGEGGLRRTNDWRPEVHDSDGLLMAGQDGNWLWRPLVNPQHSHHVTRLPADDVAGFGLLQRDRGFDSYADLESHFERRPNLWITPRGAWGAGTLELVEIPNDAEWNENVVAYWVPAQPVRGGEELRLEYTLAAQLEEPARPPLARARATRVRPSPDAPLFVVDFDDGAGPGEPQADVSANHGAPRHVVVQRNEAEAGWRCSFELADAGEEPVDVRVVLRRGEQAVSETLLCTWVRP